MENINRSGSKNTHNNVSSGANTQGAPASAIQQGNRSPAIAAELQNSPQVADKHYTRLMRLLALSNQPLTGKECAELFAKIKDQDLQKKAYSKIVNSLNLSPQERLWFCEQVQDPAEIKQQEAMLKAKDPSISIEERYAAARSIKNPEAQKEAFCCIVASVKGFHYQDLQELQAALQGLDEAVQDAVLYAVVIHENSTSYTIMDASKLIKNANKKEEALYVQKIKEALHYHDAFLKKAALDVKNPRKQQEALFQAAMKDAQSFNLSRSMDIAKLIHIKELHQQVMQAVSEQFNDEINPCSIEGLLKSYFSLSPDLQNIVSRKKLLKIYFDKCCLFNMRDSLMGGPMPYGDPISFKELIEQVFPSANEEEMCTILLGIAKNVNKSICYYEKELFREIYKRTPKDLQKDFMYALLKQTLYPTNYNEPRLLPYTTVLEILMPVSSVYDEDIDALIANVLSKEQPSFTEDWTTNEYNPIMIVDPSYEDPFYHDYAHDGNSTFHHMCQAVLNLYMPCQQISVEKKNLMLEVIASNKSFKKDFRLKIIKDYVQDEAFAQYLLLIVEHGQAQRFMRTKSAAKVDPS